MANIEGARELKVLRSIASLIMDKNSSEFVNDINNTSGSGIAAGSIAFNNSYVTALTTTEVFVLGLNSTFLPEAHNVSVNAGFNDLWEWLRGGKMQIPFYSIILLLSVVGNLLVISTLVQNRRMRTITNLFLLNLAISDILLGVLCMPVTLVGTLLRHFIFGGFLCKLIPFLQGKWSMCMCV